MRMLAPVVCACLTVISLCSGCSSGSSEDETPILRCLSRLPEASTACPRDGLVCEYGDDPRPECRTEAACTEGKWSVTPKTCTPLTTTDCPTSVDAQQGTACGNEGAICDVEGFACACTNCDNGGPVPVCEGDPIWRCSGGTTDAGCPSPIPRLGSSCAAQGQVCTYACGAGGARRCDNGLWFRQDADPCPQSSARLKRDITHLAPAQLEALRRETLAIDLATYHYRDPALGEGRKLGFVIEELPPSSPALRPNRQQVDLYGYTSMLLATIQAQQKHIEALERRLERLEREKP